MSFMYRMWEKYAAKKLWATELLDEETREVQLDTRWQDESPHKEELELLVVRPARSVYVVQRRGLQDS